MRTAALGFLLLLVVGRAAPADAAGSAYPAMLTGVSGTVEVKRAGSSSWARATLMALLKPGDVLRTAASASATVVFFADGHREKLLAKTSAGVQPAALKPVGGAQRVVAESAPASAVARILVSKGGPKLSKAFETAAGRYGAVGVREFGGPMPLSPLPPKIRADRPLFAWTPVAGADIYRFRLSDSDDKTVIERQMKETRLPFPQEAPALMRGTPYTWKVAAFAGDNELGWRDTRFVVIEAGSLRTLEGEETPLQRQAAADPKETTPSILLARLYVAYDLASEAVFQLERAAEVSPGDAELRKELGFLYRRVGHEVMAQKQFERARELDPAFVIP